VLLELEDELEDKVVVPEELELLEVELEDELVDELLELLELLNGYSKAPTSQKLPPILVRLVPTISSS
jgi:hypothetical protein